jgi:hypothetical protein
MKVKIKEYFGELPDYLTLEKTYEVEEVLDVHLFLVGDDNGDAMIVFTEDCGFLNGGSWEIVNE